MKIDEKMIEQMTEEEQQELINLIQKQQNKKRQEKINKLLKELQNVLNNLMDEDVEFDYNVSSYNDENNYYTECYIEQKSNDSVMFTFC